MKKILFILVMLCGIFTYADAQKQAEIKFDEVKMDLGKFHENDGDPPCGPLRAHGCGRGYRNGCARGYGIPPRQPPRGHGDGNADRYARVRARARSWIDLLCIFDLVGLYHIFAPDHKPPGGIVANYPRRGLIIREKMWYIDRYR